MKIIRAEHLGMCFGVRDAIALAKEEAGHRSLTILGELVHNEAVLADLRSHGIAFEKDLANVGNVATSAVMITAHGASEKTIGRVRETGRPVIEATCPLVHYAHRCLRKLVDEGYHPVVIGKAGHVEVRGLTEDFEACDVILTPDDIAAIKEHRRLGIVSQTTQPIEKVRHLVQLIRERFPHSEVRFLDTVCQPTKQRQSAAVELAQKADVIIVIGGANSNNTRELVATCRKFCGRVHHVQHAGELRSEWLEGAGVVGVTAGTSTPDYLIDEVERRIEEMHRQRLFAAAA